MRFDIAAQNSTLAIALLQREHPKSRVIASLLG